jgi:hypothetical protein
MSSKFLVLSELRSAHVTIGNVGETISRPLYIKYLRLQGNKRPQLLASAFWGGSASEVFRKPLVLEIPSFVSLISFSLISK